MRNKVVKLTLEVLLEVLLSHGIQLQKIEAIMASLGIPRSCTERALANVITLFPHKEVKGATYLEGGERGPNDQTELAMQIREVKELVEKVYNKLFLTDESGGPART